METQEVSGKGKKNKNKNRKNIKRNEVEIFELKEKM